MRQVSLEKQILAYSQYSTSPGWAKWYAKILPLKAARTIKILEKYKSHQAVLLDVGCSTGLTLGFMARRFSKTVGYDIDAEALTIARSRFQKMGLKTRFILGNGQKIPLKNNSVDLVTCLEVFEHVNRPRLLLKEIYRILKPDGILHITTANRYWPIEPHFHLPFLSYFPPKWANRYVRLFKKGSGYQQIKLPSYQEFFAALQPYFKTTDITLEVIKNYQEYGAQKERGGKIIWVAWWLSMLEKLKISPNFLLNFSLGWLFICRPKKNDQED